MLVSELITLSFIDLSAIVSGEAISSAEQADAFTRLNLMLANWSAEQLTLPQMKHELFTPTAGLPTYTLGTGGTFASSVRPMRVTGAASVSANFRQPVEVMSFDRFAATTQDPLASTSVLALKMAADNGYPSINLRIFPVPAGSPGSLWIDFWGAIAQFATVGDTVANAPEIVDALHWNLAVELFPQYARPGSALELIGSRAQQSKAALVQLNAQILGVQQAAQ